MPRSPVHSEKCENATKPRCVCSTCGGSAHGWQGHLRRARRGAEGAEELREPAQRQWEESRRRFEEKGRRVPTLYLRQAGGGVVVAELVAWLSENKVEIDQVERLGEALREDIFGKELRGFAEGRARRDPDFADYGRATAGHFWCDLLVEIANALDQAEQVSDKVPAWVKDSVLEHEDVKEWGPVRRVLAEAALDFLWKGFKALLGADFGTAALHVRVLAVLICPDPGGHTRVARCCLRPLVKEALKEYVDVELNPEWLWPEGRSERGGGSGPAGEAVTAR